MNLCEDDSPLTASVTTIKLRTIFYIYHLTVQVSLVLKSEPWFFCLFVFSISLVFGIFMQRAKKIKKDIDIKSEILVERYFTWE